MRENGVLKENMNMFNMIFVLFDFFQSFPQTSSFYAPAIFNGGHIVSPLSVRTRPSRPVRPVRNKNGFRLISFEKISVLDSNFI